MAKQYFAIVLPSGALKFVNSNITKEYDLVIEVSPAAERREPNFAMQLGIKQATLDRQQKLLDEVLGK